MCIYTYFKLINNGTIRKKVNNSEPFVSIFSSIMEKNSLIDSILSDSDNSDEERIYFQQETQKKIQLIHHFLCLIIKMFINLSKIVEERKNRI